MNRLLTLHLLSFKQFLFFFSPHQVCLRIPVLTICFHFHHIYTLVRRIQKPSNHKTIKQQKTHTHAQQQNSGTPPFLKPVTSHFPKSSPNNHLVDHEKPGEPIVPYSSPKPFPSSSPKTLFVDYLSSRANFPKSSPASFPTFGTSRFPNSSLRFFLASSFCRLKNSAKTVRFNSDGVIVLSNLVCSIFSEVIRCVPRITIVCTL